jgi:hypothetical protein
MKGSPNEVYGIAGERIEGASMHTSRSNSSGFHRGRSSAAAPSPDNYPTTLPGTYWAFHCS